MNKGKRKLVVEYNGNQFLANDLEKQVFKKLKEHGVKYSDSIQMYFNVVENKVYCVVNEVNYEVILGSK